MSVAMTTLMTTMITSLAIGRILHTRMKVLKAQVMNQRIKKEENDLLPLRDVKQTPRPVAATPPPKQQKSLQF